MITEMLTTEEEERYALACARLAQIPSESVVQEPHRSFFVHEALFLLRTEDLRQALELDALEDSSIEELEAQNRELYEELLPENYVLCYGNPDRMVSVYGAQTGPLLCFLYAELRGAIPFAFENRQWDLLVLMELFLEIYAMYASGQPTEKQLRETIYWFCVDYSESFVDARVRNTVDPASSFARDIVMQSDLSDLRYLYRYGEYISDNEIKSAAYLNTLPEEEVAAIARTWTEGFRLGFEVQNKPLHKKKAASILYNIGFERVVRQAILQLKEMGLESVMFRAASHAVNKRSKIRNGYIGTMPNPQFEYDHRNDAAFYLDERFVTRCLQAMQTAYEKRREEAAVFAGPVIMEVFGEKPFLPEAKDSVPKLSDEQKKQKVRWTNESMQIVSRFVNLEERSFTIISYPVPEIGERYEEIFHETIRLNNLDNDKYREIQQHLIDALDQGVAVRVRGRGNNETDLTVRLQTLEDPAKQTIFENCVADVNIPVGEVFTSPVLKGTGGLLHVCSVALEGLRFKDLRLRIEDGMVTEYSCGNFDDPEKGREFILENILFHHDTLPMGEFAIGTNTTAYRAAHEFGIADILPILIAEKMGPHIAFGDTCYSRQEDIRVYNPDGKEIIAKENERSSLRKTDSSEAYFDCHTDITIPYEELGSIHVLCADGTEIALIEEGRFVLPGTEELNEPLEGLV